MSENAHVLPFNPFHALPDPPAMLYSNSFVNVSPYEFTGWRDETRSWKTTCYLHAGLNPTDTYMVKGPDALDFLARATVTNMDNFEVGRIKHGICCDSRGRVVVDGVMMRTAEDEVTTYWMMPLIDFALATKRYGDYDVTGEALTGKVYLFQIGGPASIDVLERACGEDLRDIGHLRFRASSIAGHAVRICRVGMAGTLAYEVHGPIEDAIDVYQAIWEAGQPLGMRRLGSHCYTMNHAENGFPQYGVHFLHPRNEVPGLAEYLQTEPGMQYQLFTFDSWQTAGSAGGSKDNFYHNPYELGWGKMIRFDHEFEGREALEAIRDADARRIVSLEWNADDVAEVFRSQFLGEDVEPYKFIDCPTDYEFWPSLTVSHDFVLDSDGNKVGFSFGRQNSEYFRKMISIATLDTALAVEGTEVRILWGDPGTRQFQIRATVARYPYNNVMRSSTTDVTKLEKR